MVPAGYSLLLALLVAGPLLGSGYLLLRDAVSTPRSYLTDSALGLGDAAPRAVPQDALIATLSPIIDGGILVKTILVAAIWLAGWGAAALARELLHASTAPQLVAATVAIWNPYIAERLLQGHWSLLTGYAALPWIAVLATRLRAASHPSPASPAPSHATATPHAPTAPHGVAAAAPSTAPPSTTTSAGPDANSPWPAAEPDSSTASAPSLRTPSAASRRALPAALGTWAALAACLAAAGLTPTGSLLAGCVAALLVGLRKLPAVAALWLLTSAPWLVATALSGAGSATSDPAGVAAFAARAEPGLGTLGSLAGSGGIWNSTAVPGTRTTFFAVIGTAILLTLVATGIRAVIGRPGDHEGPADSEGGDHVEVVARHARRALLGLAVVAVVWPALGATGWGISVGEWLVETVPGAGLLRDTQKFVALALPAYALCAAAGCGVVAARLRAVGARGAAGTPDGAAAGRRWSAGVAAVFIALLVVALPDLAWGVGNQVRAVRYPAGWERVAGLVEGPGDVAVLPGGMFRKFRWAGSDPVLDPAPRVLPRDVLQTGELPVRGGSVAGEGTRARAVELLLLHGGSAPELAGLGVGWVLVEKRTPGPVGDSKTSLEQLSSVYSDADLELYRVPGDIVGHDASAGSRRIAGMAHLLWGAVLFGGLILAAVSASGVIPSGSRRRIRTR
ncbi:hypothetical protein [Nocardia acididurans]|uniref:hypothetical protein n=1 Tax=Nocardia acididurans TaxID=2802282 RepID=UPI001E561409